MTPAYEPVASPRFRVEETVDGPAIRVPAPRPLIATGFLILWLLGWTAAGGVCAWVLVDTREWATLVFMAFWLLGWLAAAFTLTWTLVGYQTLRIVGAGDLEIADHVLGLTRRWLYHGSEVRRLVAAPPLSWPYRARTHTPFIRSGRGAVKFEYGARTVYAAPGLSEAEGRQIAELLLPRLPAARS